MVGDMTQMVTDQQLDCKIHFRESIQKYWLSAGLKNGFDALN